MFKNIRKIIKIIKIINSKIIERKYYGEINLPLIIETVNSSWISISTLSYFNYLVRKYFEIPNTKSVLLCTSNNELIQMINNYYIYLNQNMTYDMINKIINYYINNKEILCYLSYNCKKIFLNYHDNNKYSNILAIIIDSIKNNKKCKLKYNNLNKKDIIYTNYFYVKKQNDIININNICVSKRTLENIEPYRIDMDNNNYYYIENTNFNNLYKNSTIYEILKFEIIDQIYVSTTINYFKNKILTNNNLVEYNCIYKPSFFMEHGKQILIL